MGVFGRVAPLGLSASFLGGWLTSRRMRGFPVSIFAFFFFLPFLFFLFFSFPFFYSLSVGGYFLCSFCISSLFSFYLCLCVGGVGGGGDWGGSVQVCMHACV